MTAKVKTQVLSTIDELNQYLNGNVTRSGLTLALIELEAVLEEEQYKEQKQFEAHLLQAFGKK